MFNFSTNKNVLSGKRSALIKLPIAAVLLSTTLLYGGAHAQAESDPVPVSLSSLSFVDRDLAAAKEESDVLRKELAKLRTERAELSTIKEALKKEKLETESLRFKISELAKKQDVKVEANTESPASVKKDLVKLESEYKQTLGLINTLKTEFNALKKDTQALKAENISLKAQNVAAEGEIKTVKAQNKELSTENARLQKVIDVKNEALNSAVRALSNKTLKYVSEEYQEEVLGKVMVERKGQNILVTVSTAVEKAADARFLGAVVDKKLTTSGVVYTLEASKLK